MPVQSRIVHTLLIPLVIIAGAWVCHDLYLVNMAERHKPWQIEAALAKQPKADELAKLLEQARSKYQDALYWDPDNPENWGKVGRLGLMLAQLKPEFANENYRTAVAALQRAITNMPACGRFYFDLGLVEKNDVARDRYWAAAQMLLPHEPELAPHMAQHWTNRWRATNAIKYVAWLQERLLYLNQNRFDLYGEKSIRIWEEVAPDQTVYGTILPSQEQYALGAAQIFLERQNIPMFHEMLLHVTANENVSPKHALFGDCHLLQGDIAQAIVSYRLAVASATGVHQDRLLKDITPKLIRLGYLEQAIALLTCSHVNTLDLRLELLEYAMSLDQFVEALPWLEATNAAGIVAPPRLYFLLSRCYQKRKELVKALEYATKAVAQDRTQEEYTWHFFSLLVSVKLEEKIDWYLQEHGAALRNRAQFYFWLANQYLAQNKIEKARLYFEYCVKFDPDNKLFQESLGEVYRQITQNQNK